MDDAEWWCPVCGAENAAGTDACDFCGFTTQPVEVIE